MCLLACWKIHAAPCKFRSDVVAVILRASATIFSNRLEEAHDDAGDELTFTIRDDSITLDSDFNALTFDATPVCGNILNMSRVDLYF